MLGGDSVTCKRCNSSLVRKRQIALLESHIFETDEFRCNWDKDCKQVNCVAKGSQYIPQIILLDGKWYCCDYVDENCLVLAESN